MIPDTRGWDAAMTQSDAYRQTAAVLGNLARTAIAANKIYLYGNALADAETERWIFKCARRAAHYARLAIDHADEGSDGGDY